MTERPEILDEAPAIADDERGGRQPGSASAAAATDGRRGRGDAGGS